MADIGKFVRGGRVIPRPIPKDRSHKSSIEEERLRCRAVWIEIGSCMDSLLENLPDSTDRNSVNLARIELQRALNSVNMAAELIGEGQERDKSPIEDAVKGTRHGS